MRTAIVGILSLVVGGVFLASSIPKLCNPKGFVLTVLEYRVLPASLGYTFGWILPPLEFFLALLLITGIDVRLGAFMLAFLLTSFVFAVGINMARGRDLDCQCFGTKKHRKIGWQLLLQDAMLICVSVIIVVLVPNWAGQAYWSLFHLFNVNITNYFIPPLLCIILTVGVTIMLGKHVLQWRRLFNRKAMVGM